MPTRADDPTAPLRPGFYPFLFASALLVAVLSAGCPPPRPVGPPTLVGTWKALSSVFRGRVRRYVEQPLDLVYSFTPDGRWITMIHRRGIRGAIRKVGRWRTRGTILTTRLRGTVSRLRYRLEGNRLILVPLSGSTRVGRSVFVRVR